MSPIFWPLGIWVMLMLNSLTLATAQYPRYGRAGTLTMPLPDHWTAIDAENLSLCWDTNSLSSKIIRIPRRNPYLQHTAARISVVKISVSLLLVVQIQQ